ncbi:hypothetical protein BXO88_10860 [Oribacterium sp. C9]|uniref:alpha/beta hydrolase n=1 Tax=Oribacterium sp. C9 TaxID=1943579 RepID=UPI00098F0C2A|nr:alpha/beta hydrolase [Oribacterium sp. C9]OON85752.1 hypothetical protein BXO88_10860 [Oribacterium sp. C9]
MVPKIDQSFIKEKSIFYIDGEIKGEEGNRHMCNQMFVEAYFPIEKKHPYPVVMMHGAGQTNVNWLMTPDGRMGWSDYFVSQGYEVYLCEQPSRGRSAYHPDENGPRRFHPVHVLQNNFMSDNANWPQSRLHTQWPGSGNMEFEDEIDRQFLASQVEYLPKNRDSQILMLNSGKKLLEKIGPSILLTHSQAGPFGWLLADAVPELVKGIIALEPSGPPFSRDPEAKIAENFGIADLPLHLDPPVGSLSELQIEKNITDDSALWDGLAFQDPAPKLPRLKGIPIWLIVSEASYHSQFDHLTSHVLDQCGVEHSFIRLEDVGIRGNGHMMMYEKNNLEIADYLIGLLKEKSL